MAWLRKAGSALADLLFPPCCVACGAHGAWICPRCVGGIEVILPPICLLCGLPLHPDQAAAAQDGQGKRSLCRSCHARPHTLDGMRAYAFHAGALRTAIHQLKYQNLRAVAAPLGRLMAEAWDNLRPAQLEIDAVVPVPLHRTRERERGYNQAALLARELGACLGRPVVEDRIIRARATAAQVGLDFKQRQSNVQGAFRCVGADLGGVSVLLVDDVCTTGATLEAAGAALRDGGAGSVWGYVLAHAR